MDTKKLEATSCPFCGTEPEIEIVEIGYYIHCYACDLLFGFDELENDGQYETKEELINRWNERAE